jgi:DNA-binding MarR family transcriptional regulator
MAFGKTGVVGAAEPPASLYEIGRMLEQTARLILHHAARSGEAPPEAPAKAPEPPALRAQQVRSIIALRTARGRYLGFDATDSTWSMILELYAARQEGRRLHQTGLGVAAGVPQSTALSVTRRMLSAGIFTSGPDPVDKRLLLLSLSDDAAERIDGYLRAAARVGLLFA